MGFSRRWGHQKLVLLAARLTPQASVLPPSMFAGAMVAWPVASRSMVMSLHLATGLVTSLTVTVALQVELLPLGSVTVSATVLLPTMLQSKLVLLAARLTPQASVLPPSMFAGAMVAWPVASRDRKSTRLYSSHTLISYTVFCL